MPRQISIQIYFVVILHTPKTLYNIECSNSMEILTFLKCSKDICLCQRISYTGLTYVYNAHYQVFLSILRFYIHCYKDIRHVAGYILLFCFRHYYINIVPQCYWCQIYVFYVHANDFNKSYSDFTFIHFNTSV